MKLVFKTKRILAVLCILLISVCTLSPISAMAAGKKSSNQFNITIESEWSSSFIPGKSYPFTVTVRNNGGDFSGYLNFQVRDSDNQLICYQNQLTLATGMEKSFTFVAEIPTRNYYPDLITVTVTNKKNQILCEKESNLNYETRFRFFNVGILTDDARALSYISGKAFTNFPSITTVLVKFDENNFPVNAKALDSIDAIIVADFSTDRLSSSQLDALINWVYDGGVLLVGTGESANKTLSSLSERIGVKVTGSGKFTTDFGLNNAVFQYDYSEDDINNNWEGTKELEAVYKAIDWKALEADASINAMTTLEKYDYIYKVYFDDLTDYFWTYYFGNTYSWMNTYEKSDMAYYLKFFEENIYNDTLPELLSLRERKLKEAILEEVEVTSYPSVSTNMTALESDYYTLLADNNDVTIAAGKNFGNGSICYLAFDPVKEPFVSYSGNTKCLIHIMESQASAVLYENYQHTNNIYWNSGDNTLINFLDSLSSTAPLPLIAYLTILGVYVVFTLVSWFILKKKNKQSYYWVVQPVLGVLCVLLVFLTGFSTRLTKPQARTIRIITSEAGAMPTEETYVSVLFPKTKSYQLDFSEGTNPEQIKKDQYNYFDSYTKVTNDVMTSSRLVYLDRENTDSVLVNAREAMDNECFRLSRAATKNDAGKIDFYAEYDNGTLKGYILNNSPYDLSNAGILINYGVYKIGDLKAGQRIDLSELAGQSTLVPPTQASIIYGYYYLTPINDMLWGPVTESEKSLRALGFHKKLFNRDYVYYYLLNYSLNKTLLNRISGITSDSYNNSLYDFVYNTSAINEYLSQGEFTEEEMYYIQKGLYPNGLPMQLFYSPCLVAFNEDSPEGVFTNNRSAEEQITEIWIVEATALNGVGFNIN